MRVKFRYQQNTPGIYRVAAPVAGVPQARYSTITAAIAAAVADGHSDNTDPATIEIYPGTYVENVALSAGVHLKGMADRIRNTQAIIVDGTLTFSPVGGIITENICNVAGISIAPTTASTKALIFSGTAPGRLNVRDCNIQSSAAAGGTTGLVTGSNSGTSSTFRLTDCAIQGFLTTDTELVQASSSLVVEFYGGQGGVQNQSGGTIATGLSVAGTATLQVFQQNFINGAFTRIFNITATGAVINLQRTSVQNTLAGGFMFDFAAAGTARARQSSLLLGDSTSKLANGAAGSLVLASNNYGGTSTAPLGNVDSGISSNGTSLAFGQKNSAYNEFQVGRGVGYPTIQAAITSAAAAVTGARKIVRIPPGNYSENLTLSPNVDLVADTHGFDSNSFSPVTITGTHTLDFTVASSTVNLHNIRFQSLLTNATALFAVTGASTGCQLRFKDCFLNKSFVGTTSVLALTNTATLSTLFDACSIRISADGGAMINASGAGAANVLVCNSQMGDLNGLSYNIATQSAGAPASIPFFLGVAGFASTLHLQQMRINGTTARMFTLANAADVFNLDGCNITQTLNAGECFFYSAAGSVSVRNCHTNLADAGGGGTKWIGEGAAGTFTYGSSSFGAENDVRSTLTITLLNETVDSVA